ncbi:hypothetical protein AWC28_09025 [Mycolicibacter terrae]|nr:hypothetical protein AWC28_09025 [Mycolicibacter terrae]
MTSIKVTGTAFTACGAGRSAGSEQRLGESRPFGLDVGGERHAPSLNPTANGRVDSAAIPRQVSLWR